ncbi:MAG: diguanylate cyclase [Myxococcota bacterium]
MSLSQRPARRQPLNSVSAKIIAFVFLSTFLTATVVSWISIQSTHSHLRAQIDERFPSFLRHAGDDLVERIEDGQAELALLSRGQVDHWVEDSRIFRAAARIRADGRVRESAGASPERLAALADALGPLEAPVSRPLAGADGSPVLVAARPDGGGVALAVFSEDAFVAWLTHAAVGIGGTVHLVDPEARAIASLATRGDRDPPPLRASGAVLAGLPPGAVREYTSASGEHVLGSALPIEGAGVALLIEESFESAFEPVLVVLTRVFVSDLAIILLFSALAYRVTSQIMAPIEALSEGARRISQGQIDHEIPDPESADEIGLLTRTFNDMMRKLRRNQLEIESANARLTSQYDELLSANEILAQLSITDGLTKLHNHRYFQDHLTREIKRVDRAGEPLSMLLLDLDDFKKFNDQMGHAAGDELLVKIALVLSESIRESDLLARYGGEEFVVLAPSTDLGGAVALAEKIRMEVADTPHIVDGSMRPVRVTLSVGVAEFTGDRKSFFREADKALYRAKAMGKNCVVAAAHDDLLG